MNITLRAGERFFINGAVIRIDRKASIELLNEVMFPTLAVLSQLEIARGFEVKSLGTIA
jgi:flagellar biosynthesis regulator FlbT